MYTIWHDFNLFYFISIIFSYIPKDFFSFKLYPSIENVESEFRTPNDVILE